MMNSGTEINISTESLIAESAAGNVKAFKKLVESHADLVFGLAFRILWNEADSEDAVQEVFIRVWQKIKTYDGRAKFTTWLYKITMNICIDILRKSKPKNTPSLEIGVGAEVRDEGLTPEGEFENSELAERLRRLTATLPEKQRHVFILRDVQGLSILETAEVLNISPNSVKANLSFARTAMRAKLKKWNYQE